MITRQATANYNITRGSNYNEGLVNQAERRLKRSQIAQLVGMCILSADGLIPSATDLLTLKLSVDSDPLLEIVYFAPSLKRTMKK